MKRVKSMVVAAFLFCGAASVGIALAASGPTPVAAPDRLDRRMAVEKLQSFSDFVGFEARFALGEPDDVLVMVGGELCGADVLATLPGDMVPIMAGAGFTRLECRGARGEHASVAVPR